MIKKIKESKERIAEQRDNLRDIYSYVQCLTDNCDIAIVDLESAIDKLSELL